RPKVQRAIDRAKRRSLSRKTETATIVPGMKQGRCADAERSTVACKKTNALHGRPTQPSNTLDSETATTRAHLPHQSALPPTIIIAEHDTPTIAPPPHDAIRLTAHNETNDSTHDAWRAAHLRSDNGENSDCPYS
ncbi:MAG: hypothetical protein KC983_09110, partial [Phycisphaerales bacterium]|nr:hypothetical protein [Phycisphaerales bacterium]